MLHAYIKLHQITRVTYNCLSLHFNTLITLTYISLDVLNVFTGCYMLSVTHRRKRPADWPSSASTAGAFESPTPPRITRCSPIGPILSHWQIVFCTTYWSRRVLQNSSSLACQVLCRSISRPREAFPDLWGERAAEVPISHRSAQWIQISVDSARWTLKPGLRLPSYRLAAAAGGLGTKCAVSRLV